MSATKLKCCLAQGSSSLTRKNLRGLASFSSWTLATGHSHTRLSGRLRSAPLCPYGSVSATPGGFSRTVLWARPELCWKSGGLLRFYCSGGDGANSNEHARFCEQDQKKWCDNKRLAMESKEKESPFLLRREKFKNDFLRRVIPWEKITETWETFPYYINEPVKNLLKECVAFHLENKKATTTPGASLISSSRRILLQSIPGTELYRERLVKALARDLKVPLLVLDCNVHGSYHLDDNCCSDFDSEYDSDFDYDSEDEKDKNDKKSVASKPEVVKPLKKGDRVKYIGHSVHIEADNRVILGKIPTTDVPEKAHATIHGRWSLSSGQYGEVYEVNGDMVAVVFGSASLFWMNVTDVELDLGSQSENCYIAMEALCEVLHSSQPLIVYFQDSSQWLAGIAPQSKHKEFVGKVQEMFNQLSGPVVLICGKSKRESGSKEDIESLVLLKRLKEGLKAPKRKINKLFTNILLLHPPKEEDLYRKFNQQLEEDIKIMISRSNLNELCKVLEEHELTCLDLVHINTDGMIMSKQEAETIVGWAQNQYLSTLPSPSTRAERLQIPSKSLETAITRLKDQKTKSDDTLQNLEKLAVGQYERHFIPAVVRPSEIGVKFDDIGALEYVTKTLKHLIILPLRRPELFSHGNLLRPCRGILLFGPPGTGKTLLAKALATESGANFISVTTSTFTSKWYGEEEMNVKGLFTFASKLTPVIIFIDEVDSVFTARDCTSEDESFRRTQNEFLAAMDGLGSKDTQRILVIGATNRPFDIDDAFIRRLPRRIYVDLPNAESREKILKIILSKENIEPDFEYGRLAAATKGYSGSDLKNLCVAAAMRPVEELLEQEKKECINDVSKVLRPLNLEDFIQAKGQVGPSVRDESTSMQKLKKWNEEYGDGGGNPTMHT